MVTKVETGAGDGSAFRTGVKRRVGLDVEMHVARVENQVVVGVAVAVLQKAGCLCVDVDSGTGLERGKCCCSRKNRGVNGAGVVEEGANYSTETSRTCSGERSR